jgi:hypothetical protein
MGKKNFDPTEKWLEDGRRVLFMFYSRFGVHRF